MRHYNLPQDEILELKAAHKSVKHLRLAATMAYRTHTIILLGMGMTPSEVSDDYILF